MRYQKIFKKGTRLDSSLDNFILESLNEVCSVSDEPFEPQATAVKFKKDVTVTVIIE